MSDNTTPKGEFQKRIKRTRFTPDGTDYFKSLRSQCGGGNIFANSLKMNQMNQVKPIDIPKALARLKELQKQARESMDALGKGIAYLEANLPATPAQALFNDPYSTPYDPRPVTGGTSILPDFKDPDRDGYVQQLARDHATEPIGTRKQFAKSGDPYFEVTDQELQQLIASGMIKSKSVIKNRIYVINPNGRTWKDNFPYYLTDSQVQTMKIFFANRN